jgi:hypothetical protein
MSARRIVLVAGIALILGAFPASPQEQSMSFGPPAPKWLIESETCLIAVPDWSQYETSKVTLATHVPINREFFAACNARGIYPIPYVTFYQQFATEPYQDIDLREHPEWIEIDEQGRRKRTGFWESEDAKNMYTTCPNVRGYVEALEAWVRKLMEMGAGGIFIDNLSRRAPCYGDKFGIHQHMYPDQNLAFAKLLERIRGVVKSYGADKAVLVNSASPNTLPAEFWPHIDCEMAESYICTWVSKDRWFDWHDHWFAMGQALQPHLAAGKCVIALSYLGHTPYGVKEDAYFCYASARLSGFIWATSGDVLKDNPARRLYEIRLGKPQRPPQESGEVYFRVFERGLVAVNPSEQPQTLTIAGGIPTAGLYDLFEEKAVSLDRATPAVAIPAKSGRVFLFAPDAASQVRKPKIGLTIETDPALGEVCFRVDGFDYFTHSGRWTTEYYLGPNFGKFTVYFAEPGTHVVEIVDIVPRDMQTPAGYGSGERLGQFMDPAQPTKPSRGAKYRFREWSGMTASQEAKVEVRVEKDLALTAHFDRQSLR